MRVWFLRLPAAVVLIAVLVAVACARGDDGGRDGDAASATAVTSPTATATVVARSSPVSRVTPILPAAETHDAAPEPGALLLVANSAGREVSFIDPTTGAVEQLEVGAAPWDVVMGPDGRAFVSTAEGIAVVDIARRQRTALVPYLSDVGEARVGEYRPGGMGLAVTADGARVYAGVYLAGQNSRLEVLDTSRLEFVGSAVVGIRPFDVLISPDGREVYSVDHDSFSVTVVDTRSLATRTLPIEPFGRAAFDKPHYAALDARGHLLLPVQGRGLVDLDPASDATSVVTMHADTHQHGVVLSPDGRTLCIVGTGPAGGATGGPNLTMIDLATRAERVIELSRPHEMVAVSDDSATAFLTGGYTFAGGGWDGVTVVDLASGRTREIAAPDRPLGIAIVRG
jgi:streptogramin lyase